MHSDRPSRDPKGRGFLRDLLAWWWFVPAYLLLTYYADLVLGWVVGNPLPAVFAIGMASFLAFSLDTVRKWRDGSEIARSVHDRMTRGPLDQATDMRGAIAILIGMALVWLAVLTVAVAHANADQRPWVILIVGGMTALVAGPFALYPVTLLIGAASAPCGLKARLAFRLAAPVPDALVQRADLAAMPPSAGLGPVARVAEDHWRSPATGFLARLNRMSTDYRVEASDDRLTVDGLTSGGDREHLMLARDGETVLHAWIEVVARSAWSRAVLRLAGRRSYANTVATAEAARLTRMLGVSVTAGPIELA